MTQKRAWSHRGFGLVCYWCCLMMVALGLMIGCGDKSEISANEQAGSSGGEQQELEGDRYDRLEPLDLEVGEAKPGMHLRPGIETIVLSDSSSSPEVTIDEEARTVVLTGDARQTVEETGEIWTEDILIGDDFIYLIVDVREQDDGLVIEVERFELLRVVHGDWELEFDSHDVSSPLWATIDPSGNVEMSYGSFLNDEIADSEASAEVSWDVGGGVSFPVDWDGEFRGRVSFAGYGFNTHYECQSYVETVVRRRYRLFGPHEEYEREVQPERFCVDYLLVMGTIGLQAQAHANIDASAWSYVEMDEEMKLGQGFRVPLGYTGLALWFSPYVSARAHASVSGALAMGLEAQTSVSVPLGFEYDPHETGFSLLPNERFAVEQSGSVDPHLTAEVHASLQVATQLGMRFAISDVVTERGLRATGPVAGIEFGKETNATPVQVDTGETPPEPCLSSALYISAFGEANLRGEIAINSRWSWGIDLVDGLDKEYRVDLATYESSGNDYCIVGGP